MIFNEIISYIRCFVSKISLGSLFAKINRHQFDKSPNNLILFMDNIQGLMCSHFVAMASFLFSLFFLISLFLSCLLLYAIHCILLPALIYKSSLKAKRNNSTRLCLAFLSKTDSLHIFDIVLCINVGYILFCYHCSLYSTDMQAMLSCSGRLYQLTDCVVLKLSTLRQKFADKISLNDKKLFVFDKHFSRGKEAAMIP